MKKLIVSLVIAIFLAATLTAGAVTVGFPMESKIVTGSTALVIAKNKEIYGYTLIATAATAGVGLYDSKTLGAASDTAVIAEAYEAVSGASTTVWFPKPLVTDNGLTVVLFDGSVVLYYQK